MCTSVPQMVVVVMRTSASLGPTSGTGFSTISIRPLSIKAAAFIMRAMLCSSFPMKTHCAEGKASAQPTPQLSKVKLGYAMTCIKTRA